MGHEFIMSMATKSWFSRYLSSIIHRIQRTTVAGLRFLGNDRRTLGLSSNIGQVGEDLAEAFLRQAGYRIVASRHRTPRHEIDLIAIDRKTIVFVEVKT